MSVNENVVEAVDEIVKSSDAPDGYVDVLRALSVLMARNEHKETQRFGKLVSEMAEMLNDYLEEKDEDEE